MSLKHLQDRIELIEKRAPHNELGLRRALRSIDPDNLAHLIALSDNIEFAHQIHAALNQEEDAALAHLVSLHHAEHSADLGLALQATDHILACITPPAAR